MKKKYFPRTSAFKYLAFLKFTLILVNLTETSLKIRMVPLFRLQGLYRSECKNK